MLGVVTQLAGMSLDHDLESDETLPSSVWMVGAWCCMTVGMTMILSMYLTCGASGHLDFLNRKHLSASQLHIHGFATELVRSISISLLDFLPDRLCCNRKLSTSSESCAPLGARLRRDRLLPLSPSVEFRQAARIPVLSVLPQSRAEESDGAFPQSHS